MPVTGTHDMRELSGLRLIDTANGRNAGGADVFTSYLAVPNRDRRVGVERIVDASRVRIYIQFGKPPCLDITASGELFAALHPELRTQLLGRRRPALTTDTLAADLQGELAPSPRHRVSIIRGESYLSIPGLAVPMRDLEGALVEAVQISSAEAAIEAVSEPAIMAVRRKRAIAIRSDRGVVLADHPRSPAAEIRVR